MDKVELSGEPETLGAFARLEGRDGVDEGRLAMRTPAQERQGMRSDAALVHIASYAPRFPLRLDVCQGLSEGLLGLRIGFRDALTRPLAPKPQLVQIPPHGRAGASVPEGALDRGCC